MPIQHIHLNNGPNWPNWQCSKTAPLDFIFFQLSGQRVLRRGILNTKIHICGVFDIICFWGDLKSQKIASEINWPLRRGLGHIHQNFVDWSCKIFDNFGHYLSLRIGFGVCWQILNCGPKNVHFAFWWPLLIKVPIGSAIFE